MTRGELRLPPQPLVGREYQVRKVRERLSDPETRLLTLTGTGGVGKTRLVVVAAGGIGGRQLRTGRAAATAPRKLRGMTGSVWQAGPMVRIHVLGGTGFAGAAVVNEGVRRGHQVTSFSRGVPSMPVEGAEYVIGSLLEDQMVQRAVTDADVVFETISPRGDMAGRLEGVVADLIVAADTAHVRLGVLGGVSSVLVSEEGPRLFDVTVTELPAEVLPEIRTGLALLDALRAAPETLDWFYVSPAEEFGAWFPQAVTGSYRISDDVLLKDEDGKSAISAADLAIAVLDEIENPQHRRRRFHVAH